MLDSLQGVVVLFGAALATAWLMRVLRAPTILGFLLAGMLIGPHGLNFIHQTEQQDQVHFFAELGLALLLFTVGLELSPAPLIRMGRRLLAAAGWQMGLTAVLVALGAAWLSPEPLTWLAAGVIGFAAALSSTAIVLRHLSDSGQIDTPAGTVTTGVLLIQDVAVIVLLILLPMLQGAAGAGPVAAVLKIVGAIVGLTLITLAAHLAMPYVVHGVFRYGGRELTTLFALVMACVGAWAAGQAEWSWGLGSFIAGLLLAQTDVRHQLHADITPFRDAFNALFFMSIGMLVNLDVVVGNAGLLTLAVLATLAIKTIITAGGVVAAGWPLRIGLTAGLGLCTISEFGYVLAKEGARLGLLSPMLLDKFVAWTVGTMLLGALFVPQAERIAAVVDRALRRGGRTDDDAPAGDSELGNHVIVVGYGVVGRNLATVLRATRIPHAVIEMNRGCARAARGDGETVVVGDATHVSIMRQAGLARARALVIAIADARAARDIVAQAHVEQPDLYILARTRLLSELEHLHRLGAARVIPEEFETSIELFVHVLSEFAIPQNVIEQQVNLVRAGRYGMLRGRSVDRAARQEWLQLLEAAVTQTLLVSSDSPAAGKTIAELDLRKATGVTIVAVTRAGKPTPTPGADFRLEAGDVLVLVGTHQQLDAARAAVG